MERHQEGYTQVEIAEFLGVSPRSVRRWVAAYRKVGDEGLAAKPSPGRPPKLTDQQAETVLSWLSQSPTVFGFANELWTAPRIAHLIRQEFNVRFHPRYLNDWLTARGVTRQKPKRQARQRDQERIDHWIAHDWPRILKRGTKTTPTSC